MSILFSCFELNSADATNHQQYFFKDVFALRIINNIAILVSFGVVFPPLAVVLCVSMFILTWLTQLQIGRFLIVNKDTAGIANQINEECNGVGRLLRKSMWILAPFASVFYAFFLFDTYGDQTGWKEAVWIAIVMSFAPCLFLTGLYFLSLI